MCKTRQTRAIGRMNSIPLHLNRRKKAQLKFFNMGRGKGRKVLEGVLGFRSIARINVSARGQVFVFSNGATAVL